MSVVISVGAAATTDHDCVRTMSVLAQTHKSSRYSIIIIIIIVIFDKCPCISGLQCSAINCSHFARCATDGYSEEWIQLQIHQQRLQHLAIDGVEITEMFFLPN